MNFYVSRDAAKSYIGIQSAIKNARIDALIEKTSRFVDKYCDRFFYPKLEERFFDYQDNKELLLDCDLLSVTTLYHDRKNSTIDSGDIILYPLDGPPYHKVFVDPTADFLTYTDFPERALAIDGVFGYCEDKEDTGVVLSAGIDANDTEMLIDDGSLIEVGWTLLIDDEQIFVKDDDVIDSTAKTAEAVDTYEKGIDANDGTLLKKGEIIRIDSEDMLIESIATDTLTVARAYNGTTAAEHITGADIYVFRKFTIEREKNGTTKEAHTTSDVIYKYVPPLPIQQAVAILVARADKRSDSAWSDITGVSEFGTPSYFKSVPDDVRDLLAPFRRMAIGAV